MLLRQDESHPLSRVVHLAPDHAFKLPVGPVCVSAGLIETGQRHRCRLVAIALVRLGPGQIANALVSEMRSLRAEHSFSASSSIAPRSRLDVLGRGEEEPAVGQRSGLLALRVGALRSRRPSAGRRTWSFLVPS
jgi:hypothetical protein